MRSILLLPLVARCLETIECMYMAHVCFLMSIVLTVWWSVGMFVV